MKWFVLLGCVLALAVCGCSGWNSQPGETPAEVKRRHAHTLKANQEQLMADIDKVLLIDKPSKLTDMRVP
jgi:hypothetical protein